LITPSASGTLSATAMADAEENIRVAQRARNARRFMVEPSFIGQWPDGWPVFCAAQADGKLTRGLHLRNLRRALILKAHNRGIEAGGRCDEDPGGGRRTENG
jgi:hypothetical protein